MGDGRAHTSSDEFATPAIPEDVAILYSWANLPGAKYRDFSASRREYRAQQRVRQAEQQQRAELASAYALEEAALREVEQARQALELAREAELESAGTEAEVHAEEAFRLAESNARRERDEAVRRQTSAETLRLRAQAARKEMLEARQRAEEQAARYAEYDAQYRAQVQPRDVELPGQLNDPYYYTGQVDPAYFASTPGVRTAQATRTATGRRAYVSPVHPGASEYDAGTLHAYRPGTTFAPSPAQDYRTLSPIRNLRHTEERSPSVEQSRRPDRDWGEAEGSATDRTFFSKRAMGRPPRALHSAAIDDFGVSGEDLHFRPGGSFPQNDTYVQNDAGSESIAQGSSWRGGSEVSWPADRGYQRREGAADRRARTTRQPRAEHMPELDAAEASASVPPAWLAYNEEPETFESVQSDLPGRQLHALQFPGSPEFTVSEARRERFSEAVSPAMFPDDLDIQRGSGSATDAPAFLSTPAADTLQASRERVAARWFALQGLMEHDSDPNTIADLPRNAATPALPILVVLALSGGVGRTSMVATLGRTLSSLGQKVLLADTNTHGLLPYYFGARDLRPGALRTFTPPPGSPDAPILMAHYDRERIAESEGAQDDLVADLVERSSNAQCTLIDVGGNGMWMVRRLLPFHPRLLVPLKPDMNSVLSMQTLERLLSEMHDAQGKSVRPFYVLNQYDPALPLHLDVREVLRQSLGDRLLSTTIHRAPEVPEALAEGMTVIDYAHGAAVAQDYRELAAWVQRVAGMSGSDATQWNAP